MRPSARVAPVFLLVAALTGVVALPSSAQDPGVLQGQLNQARSREQALGGQVAQLGRLADRMGRQVALLEQRRSQVEADLAGDQARLAAVQADLRRQRARLVRLRARLAQVRRTLAGRLVAAYKSPQEDLTTVIVTSRSLADLLERTRYLKAMERQDREILVIVRNARGDAATQTRRLSAVEARQRRIVVGLEARREALAAMGQAVAARQAALVQARAARAAALAATRSNRQHLESRLATVEAQMAQVASAGVSGSWAIPSSVVNCESGGQNLPPNSAGASGYYQILPSTWKLYGGSGSAANHASKAEQDRVAARIWHGGGASQWVCSGIVGVG